MIAGSYFHMFWEFSVVVRFCLYVWDWGASVAVTCFKWPVKTGLGTDQRVSDISWAYSCRKMAFFCLSFWVWVLMCHFCTPCVGRKCWFENNVHVMKPMCNKSTKWSQNSYPVTMLKLKSVKLTAPQRPITAVDGQQAVAGEAKMPLNLRGWWDKYH